MVQTLKLNKPFKTSGSLALSLSNLANTNMVKKVETTIHIMPVSLWDHKQSSRCVFFHIPVINFTLRLENKSWISKLIHVFFRDGTKKQ